MKTACFNIQPFTNKDKFNNLWTYENHELSCLLLQNSRSEIGFYLIRSKGLALFVLPHISPLSIAHDHPDLWTNIPQNDFCFKQKDIKNIAIKLHEKSTCLIVSIHSSKLMPSIKSDFKKCTLNKLIKKQLNALNLLSTKHLESVANLYNLTNLCLNAVQTKKKQTPSDELILEQFIEKIKQDLPKFTDVEAYCKHINWSKNKLQTLFKQTHNQTIYQYYIVQKLTLAKHLVSENNWTITEISEYLGYTHPSHFIYAYKQKFGQTPKNKLK